MDRADAERVFQLVAELRGDLRDRFVPDRWWAVWVAMGGEIMATNTLTHVLLSRGVTTPGVHVTIFAVQVLALAATIRVAQRNRGGHRSQRETFVWWIWTTFLLAAGLVVGLTGLLGLPMFSTAAVLPVLAAFAFSMMGMAVGRVFAAAAGVFAVAAVLMAAFPAVQFLTYGLAWLLVLETLGLLHYPRTPAAGRAL